MLPLFRGLAWGSIPYTWVAERDEVWRCVPFLLHSALDSLPTPVKTPPATKAEQDIA